MIGKFFKCGSRPKISCVLIVYDMAREAPRTLRSLSSQYQQGIDEELYEVVVVDNGSPEPLGAEVVRSFGKNFSYHYIEDAKKSPASAVNFGVRQSKGKIVGILIDGARIVTPGLLHYVDLAFKMHDDPTVAALGWHLGHEPQQKSVAKGYNEKAEDQLLQHISWPQNGYRLFEISSLAGSSRDGCFLPVAESNAVFVTRQTFDKIGGFEEGFNVPGGGLVNLDFFKRACERPAAVVILPGEGCFHQIHGGVSTNISLEESGKHFQKWNEQYKSIRGVYWKDPEYQAEYLGHIPPEALSYVSWSAEHACNLRSSMKT